MFMIGRVRFSSAIYWGILNFTLLRHSVNINLSCNYCIHLTQMILIWKRHIINKLNFKTHMNCIYRYFTRKSLDKFEFGPDKVQVRSSSSEKIRPSELFHTGSYRPAASIDPHLIIFYIELCLLNLKKENF